jgi:tetratricopeptide (TPR) repeat protein
MRTTLLFIFTSLINWCLGQNCKAFLYEKDTLQYEACLLAEKRGNHYQYSKAYQEALDESIAKCPRFSYGYLHKSVAYLKSGDFLTWKKLIDNAVKLNPRENLGYRAWCRYQFFRDYQGALDDIAQLRSIANFDIGYSAGGEYHLNIAEALCYKALQQRKKAAALLAAHVQNPSTSIGNFDYLHLGVLYLELKNYDEAVKALQQQGKKYDIAENRYYLALTYRALKQPQLCKENLELAKELYLKNRKMFDPYTEQMDKIYLQQIEEALASQSH